MMLGIINEAPTSLMRATEPYTMMIKPSVFADLLATLPPLHPTRLQLAIDDWVRSRWLDWRDQVAGA